MPPSPVIEDRAATVRAELDETIARARDALLARQRTDGHWCFELETDCTLTSEFILFMHCMDEIDHVLQSRLARFIRSQQILGDEGHGGWPIFPGGTCDLSCTVKAYFALKLAGDDPEAPHLRRARAAILVRGGAAKCNVFTRITLALFRQVPWRAVPCLPVEMMLLPRWFPFHLDKVSYWARTVMVPLAVVCSLKLRARNPTRTDLRELFTTPAEAERGYYSRQGVLNKVFLALDWLGRTGEPLIPKFVRQRALRRAEAWIVPRLNGEDGLGAIYPAMINAYEALALLGYPKDHPLRTTCRRSLHKLIAHRADGSAYLQSCLSPAWDTAWAATALQSASANEKDAGDEPSAPAVARALAWLAPRQILDVTGDWAAQAPDLAPGGWAFQYANAYYPDLDDTALIASLLHTAAPGANPHRIRLERAADWLVGLQSSDGGFAAFDANNTGEYLNRIPFADHRAMLDPPTPDVTGRVLGCLGVLRRSGDAGRRDRAAMARSVAYLRRAQRADGSFWGRWGTNYIYGTWSVLTGLALAGEDLTQPWVRKAVTWLERCQHADGGWGETNDSYRDPALRGTNGGVSTPHSTAWALLALLAVGEGDTSAVRRGVQWLLAAQQFDGEHAGLWHDPSFNAPGHPCVIHLKYHGYNAYFPLYALARYRDAMLPGVRKSESETPREASVSA